MSVASLCAKLFDVAQRDGAIAVGFRGSDVLCSALVRGVLRDVEFSRA